MIFSKKSLGILVISICFLLLIMGVTTAVNSDDVNINNSINEKELSIQDYNLNKEHISSIDESINQISNDDTVSLQSNDEKNNAEIINEIKQSNDTLQLIQNNDKISSGSDVVTPTVVPIPEQPCDYGSIYPIVNFIVNDSYNITADDTIDVTLTSNIRGIDCCVEVPGVLNKTNFTFGDDWSFVVSLGNFTNSGVYTIVCSFPDGEYPFPPAILGSDYVPGVYTTSFNVNLIEVPKLDSDLVIGIWDDVKLYLGDDGNISGEIEVGQWVNSGNVAYLSTVIPNIVVSIDGVSDGAYLVGKNVIKFRNLEANKNYVLRVLVNDSAYNSKEYTAPIFVFNGSSSGSDVVTPIVVPVIIPTPVTNNNVIKSKISSSANNKVIKSKLSLSANNKVFKLKTKVKKYSVVLKFNNKPVKNLKLTLKINGKIYTAITNKKGNAVFKIKLNKKGTYIAKIIVKNNDKYKDCSKHIKIKVKK